MSGEQKYAEAPISSLDDFEYMLGEIMSSYEKFIRNSSDASKDDLKNWFQNEFEKRLPESSEDIWRGIESAVKEIEYNEDVLLSAADDGQNVAFWLYNFLRPDPYLDMGEDDDETNSPLTTSIFSQLPAINQSINNILRRTMQDKSKMNPNNISLKSHASSSMKHTIMSEWKRNLKLDSVNQMSSVEMSKCAMDDLALSIGMNATMMGAGCMALTALCCLGTNVVKARGINSNTWRDCIGRETIRSSGKSSMRLAITGALKVASTRNTLPFLTMASSTTALTAIAVCGIECCDAVIHCTMGDISPWQAIEQASRTSVASICALELGAQGAAIGATAMSSFPASIPILSNSLAMPQLGGIIGLTVGTMASGFLVHNLAKRQNLENLLEYAKEEVERLNAMTDRLVNYNVLYNEMRIKKYVNNVMMAR